MPNVRGAVARMRNELRSAAAERYRAALAENSAEVRRYRLAAAAVDRLAGMQRAVVRAPGAAGELADSSYAVARRLRRPASLVVTAAAVSADAALSLSLAGSRPARDSMPALRLCAPDGGAEFELGGVTAGAAESVRLVAELPAEAFAEETTWLVALSAGDADLPFVVPGRAALADRWPDRSWPPRLGLDAGHRLVVSGRAPRRPAVEHAVSLGLTSLVVTWSAGAPELRLTPRHGSGALLVTGHAGADGQNRATVDLLELAARAPDTWDAAVAGDEGRWRPLRLPAGDPAVPDAGAVLLRLGGRSVGVRAGYRDAGRLAVTVQAPGGPGQQGAS